MKIDLTVNGYIFDEDKLFLMMHVHKNYNTWLPVGGHLHENDVFDDRLLFKIKDETNLDVELVHQPNLEVVGRMKKALAKPFLIEHHSVVDHDHIAMSYLCKVKKPYDVVLHEEQGSKYGWFSKEEALKLDLLEHVRKIVELAFKEWEAYRGKKG